MITIQYVIMSSGQNEVHDEVFNKSQIHIKMQKTNANGTHSLFDDKFP